MDRDLERGELLPAFLGRGFAQPVGEGTKGTKQNTTITKNWYRSKLFVPFVSSIVLFVASSRS
jgi:hypothetical protein